MLNQATSPAQWSSAGNTPLPAPMLQGSTLQTSAVPAGRAYNPQQQRTESPTTASRIPPQQQQTSQAAAQPQHRQSPSVFDAFGPAQHPSQGSAQPQRPQSPSVFATYGSAMPGSQPQRPQSPSVFDSFDAMQPVTQPYTQLQQPQSSVGFQGSSQPARQALPQQTPISLLDDHLLPPSQGSSGASLAQLRLQHTQSLPTAPLYPQPKAVSSKRFTEPPQASTPLSAASQPAHQSGQSFQQPVPPQNFLGTSNPNPFDTSSSASFLPVAANPFAVPSIGDLSLARPSAPVLRTKRADVTPSASPSSSPTKADGRSQQQHEAPLSFDARLPPLHPKLSAPLTLLAAAHGSLFAGPSSHGGLLQWARPEGNMRQPSAGYMSLTALGTVNAECEVTYCVLSFADSTSANM